MPMDERSRGFPFHMPSATYRLQFHRDFTFDDAQRLVPYLRDLGIGDCYCSPYLMARPGSRHGYDIIDHTRLNPEVGDEAAYGRFVEALHAAGLGQVLDFVPNHMGIDPRTNRWWCDVLENGPSSVYGRFFDIDWHPVKAELRAKVLLPILGDQYGIVLERGELRLGFGHGTLQLDYFDHRFPINPRHATAVYECNLQALGEELGEEDARPSRVPEHHHSAEEPAGGDGHGFRARDRTPSRKGGGARSPRPAHRAGTSHPPAHRRRGTRLQRRSWKDPGASTCCTICWRSRRIDSPTGGRPRTRSTTGASSTSTTWPAFAWRIGTSSRRRTCWSRA